MTLRGAQDFSKETVDVMKTAKELEWEVETEDVNELLQPHDKYKSIKCERALCLQKQCTAYTLT